MTPAGSPAHLTPLRPCQVGVAALHYRGRTCRQWRSSATPAADRGRFAALARVITTRWRPAQLAVKPPPVYLHRLVSSLTDCSRRAGWRADKGAAAGRALAPRRALAARRNRHEPLGRRPPAGRHDRAQLDTIRRLGRPANPYAQMADQKRLGNGNGARVMSLFLNKE